MTLDLERRSVLRAFGDDDHGDDGDDGDHGDHGDDDHHLLLSKVYHNPPSPHSTYDR